MFLSIPKEYFFVSISLPQKRTFFFSYHHSISRPDFIRSECKIISTFFFLPILSIWFLPYSFFFHEYLSHSYRRPFSFTLLFFYWNRKYQGTHKWRAFSSWFNMDNEECSLYAPNITFPIDYAVNSHLLPTCKFIMKYLFTLSSFNHFRCQNLHAFISTNKTLSEIEFSFLLRILA